MAPASGIRFKVLALVGAVWLFAASSPASPAQLFSAGSQAFTVSGNYSCPAAATLAFCTLFGAGGGGGGGSTTAGAGGGATGAFLAGYLLCANGPFAVTIGAGGAAGASSSACTAGGNGGSTSISQQSGADSMTVLGGGGAVITTCAGGAAAGLDTDGGSVNIEYAAASYAGANGSGATGGVGAWSNAATISGTPTGMPGGNGGNSGAAGTAGTSGFVYCDFY